MSPGDEGGDELLVGTVRASEAPEAHVNEGVLLLLLRPAEPTAAQTALRVRTAVFRTRPARLLISEVYGQYTVPTRRRELYE